MIFAPGFFFGLLAFAVYFAGAAVFCLLYTRRVTRRDAFRPHRRSAGRFGDNRLRGQALDGAKIKANASKHKAMSYERMAKRAAELEADVARR